MDDISESLSAEELAEFEKAQKKYRARMRGMTLFCLILAVPIFIGAYLVWRVKGRAAEDKAWAEAELAKPKPDERAFGALGSSYLNEGRIAESLPLLKKAAAIEAKGRGAVEAHLILVEAHLAGLEKKLPEANAAEAAAALQEMLSYVPALPQGPAAGAWHGAGKLYLHLGMREKALECLKKASELQPDDWVDEGGGRRFKHRGIASIYQKDYSGALYQ